MTTLFAIAAVLCAGAMLGIELSVALAINPLADAQPTDRRLEARAASARRLGGIMPFWYGAVIVLSVVIAILSRHEPRMWASVAAAALFVATIIGSIALLVPINNRAATWTAASAPPDWSLQLTRWDRMHAVRIVALAAGLSLLVYAIT